LPAIEALARSDFVRSGKKLQSAVLTLVVAAAMQEAAGEI
jgi:hypothetical protein